VGGQGGREAEGGRLREGGEVERGKERRDGERVGAYGLVDLCMWAHHPSQLAVLHPLR
jgi:hypothetical protein